MIKTYVIGTDDLFFIVDGEEYVDEGKALAILLADEVLFCNNFDVGWEDKQWTSRTTVLFVSCNDIFAWGCADSEPFMNKEIGPLLKMHLEDPQWGTAKWCCIRRNEQPQNPVKQDMIKDGSWNNIMEALPQNQWEKRIMEKAKEPEK